MSKRKSYSIEYTKGIAEESQDKNLTAFCKERNLDLRMVRNAKKPKCGSGRQTLYSELKDVICEWVAERRAKALVVRRADIQKFALTNVPQFGILREDFKALNHRLDNFFLQHELSLRKSKTLFKLEGAEIVKRAISYGLNELHVDK